MKRFSAHQWGFIAFIFFSVVALIAPEQRNLESISILFGAVTFVFATMSGFFLTRLNHRFDTVRDEISAEDADFLSLYYFSTVIGGAVHAHVRKTIDAYYMTVFENSISKYHRPTRDEYFALYDIFTLRKSGDDSVETKAVYESMAGLLTDIERHRNTIARAGEEQLNASMWTIVIILACMVVVSIFLLRDGSLFFDLAAVLLSTTVVVIVALMRDLERFRLGGVPLAAESGYELLDAMGLPRYVLADRLTSGRVKIPRGAKQIRIGTIDPVTGERTIALTDVSTLPPHMLR